jgi:hypothetical protein
MPLGMIAPMTAMPSISAWLSAAWKQGTAGEPSGACGAHRLEVSVNKRVPQLLRRTFEADVWACPCGGRRKVLAVVTSRRTAEAVLANLGVLPGRPPVPVATAPPQLALAL